MTSAPEITVEVDQNPYLAPGASRVDAVLTVTATGAGPAPAEALEIIVVDCGRWRPRCSAAWTSSPGPRTSPPTSGR